MPWTIQIDRDSDKTDVGQVTATFVEQGTTAPVFMYSKRIQLTTAERNTLFSEAFAARNAWRTENNWETTNSANTQTLMNSNDPNPVP